MKTLSSLCCYLVTILFYLFGVCAVLNVFGLGNTVGSLLATAGIGGLAIGFGAQSIIKDFFSGAFLIFEGQIEIGDYICVAGLTGTVEKIQLRTTQIRATNGELHIIPNGNITNVTNYSRGGLLAIADIPMPVSYTHLGVERPCSDHSKISGGEFYPGRTDRGRNTVGRRREISKSCGKSGL